MRGILNYPFLGPYILSEFGFQEETFKTSLFVFSDVSGLNNFGNSFPLSFLSMLHGAI